MSKTINITITKATREDLLYIQEKTAKYRLDGSNLTFDQFYVAKNSTDKTVGFIRCIEHDGFYEPATLGLDYYWRNKGIGSMLFRHIMDTVKKDKPVYILTHLPDFFKKFNFKITKEYPQKIEEKIKTVCKPGRGKLFVLCHKG